MQTYDSVSNAMSRLTRIRRARRALMLESAGGMWVASSSPSSMADTDGCSRGVLRPYQAQIAINASGGSAHQKSARCQPNACMKITRSGGANAAPTCADMTFKPLAKAQRLAGSQDSMTPAMTGKNGACAAPSMNCEDTRIANNAVPDKRLGGSGTITVAATAISDSMVSTPRAPARCPNTPPGNCIMA